jgi:hypothetical protein
LGSISPVPELTPLLEPDGSFYTAVACAWWTTCALDARSGRAVVFGSTKRGCTAGLTDGGTASGRLSTATPVDLAAVLSSTHDSSADPRVAPAPWCLAAVVAGWHHFAVRTADGRLVMWGRGDYGQQGDGGTEDRADPHLVPGRWRWIASGSEHLVGVDDAGDVRSWGWSEHGQTGQPAADVDDDNDDIDDVNDDDNIDVDATHIPNVLVPLRVRIPKGTRADGRVYAGGGHSIIPVWNI